ncbi:transglycosylase SLT domain-containing protein [Streptomyces sp. NY05-11A]|uniref:transglycosylase SLT domain-containing protein n=1 Tax=Streptomyces soliscabiei TaxID=588897 RepID=UPI0029B3CA01|nr:transglycosylase SLT domain-containing protein [Streptomyces sp. NY05-11A]MDX2677473.1 transglycosylase SLT domain-containing protein [Streptomyces sp. NY05-11A]
MPKNTHKIAIAGAATLGAAALAFSVMPADAQTTTTDAVSSARVAYSTVPVQAVKASVTDQLAQASVKVDAIQAKKKAAADAVAEKKAAAAAAVKKAAAARKAQEAASRSAERVVFKKAGVKKYADNLDGWIKHSLDIMKSKGIPGSYHGLHKNIMRESSGNPNAINDWDINAINGIPSKGLLQVIPPTFASYHVSGTSWNIYDPVANITAAANYASDKYGSIDNVNSAY